MRTVVATPAARRHAGTFLTVVVSGSGVFAGSLAFAGTATAGVPAVSSAPSLWSPALVRQADTPGTLTWSVSPTPREENESRTSFFLDVKEGQSVKDSVRIRNLSDVPLNLNVYATDAVTTDSGSTDLLPAKDKPTDIGTWIDLGRDKIEVAAGETVDIPFTMKVPNNAESGDHTGGIVTSYLAPGQDANGQAVTLDQRLASRLAARVDGPLRPALEVSGFTASYSGPVNPVGRGDLDVSYTVTNTGNVRLSAEQIVDVKGALGLVGRKAKLEAMPEILPGNKMTVTSTVTGVWPALRTNAEVSLRPLPTREGDDFTAASTPKISKGLWTIPWSTFLVLFLLLGIGAAVAWSRKQAKAREDRRVAASIEALRQAEGLTGSGPGGGR